MTILKAWFYFYWHRTICNIIWVSGVPHNYSIFLYIKRITNTIQCLITIFHLSYYYIIDYISYAVHYLALTYLFYNWKFLPFNLLRIFWLSSHAPFICQFPAHNLLLPGCFCSVSFVHLLCFSDFLCKWNHIFTFLFDLFHVA